MPSRINILVVGGYDPVESVALATPTEDFVLFCTALGHEIIEQGHNLVSGCQTDLDRVVAEAAASHPSITDLDENDELRIISYVLDGKQPAFKVGTIMTSAKKDWDLGSPDPSPPEVIQAAHAIILIGGFYGTYSAANWARLQRVPLLPFFRFGGAAREVYNVESQRFDQVYGETIRKIEYDQVLKSASRDWKDLARDTVQLAEKVASTRSVLVCMSFTDRPDFKDLLAAIKLVCAEFEYEAERIDESNLSKRVLPQILAQVKRSAFVVVDVTELKPNVFYELGFADGAAKEVVLVAKKGTELPFNVADVPVIFWESFEEFKHDLRKRLNALSSFHGRRSM